MAKSVAKKGAKPVRVVAPRTGEKEDDVRQVIHLLVKENPKRGNSRVRYGYYRDGMPVEDYVARCVKAGNSSSAARADLRWDVEREFIAIK